MENLVKRYFWVVNLLVLAVLAYLSARVANNILAGEIAALPTWPAAPDTKQLKGARTGMDRTQEWMLAISERNLFNSEPPEPDDEIETDAGPSRPEGMIPGEEDECDKSDAKLSLVATMVAEPAEWSMAVVDEQETGSRLVREGQPIAERTIVAIYRERMVLAKGAGYECIALGEKRGGGMSTARPGAPRSNYGSTAPPLARANYKEWIKKTGANNYEIDRASLNEQLDDLNNLSRQARVIPHYRDGKPQGFKLVGVRPGSLYSHIGIRSGDVLKAIGEEEITSPNKALELYEKLKSTDNVAVEIERRGRKVTLEYNIK